MRSSWPVSVVLLLCAPVAIAASDKTPPAAAKAAAATPAPSALTPEQQVAGLEAQCAKTSEARAKRQAEKSLYERLGGEAKIHAITREVVRLHHQNKAISHFLVEGHDEELANRVAQFVISGTGGPAVYKGPSLSESHAHMKLTNADFLAAGGDVIQGMKNLGYGENEIDEMVCIFVGLRAQVVLPPDAAQKP